MKKLYVKAASKKALNEMLKTDQVLGTEYRIDGVNTYGLDTLKEKVIVALYTKTVGGNPVATSYFEFDPAKNAVK